MKNRKLTNLDRYITILQRNAVNTLNQQMEIEGLSASNANLLLFIHDYGESTSQQLSVQGAMNKGLVSRDVKKLDNLGFIELKKQVQDNRSFKIGLTEVGREACLRIIDLKTNIWSSLLNDVSPEELDTFYETLEKVAGKIVGHNFS